MIVITGGAGFIGSALLHRLNQAGHEDILVVDRLDESPKWKNLRGASYLDYMDADDFLECFAVGDLDGEINTIFHLGACSDTSEADSDYLMHNNTLYTRDLALLCLENQIRLIYASSAATYGDGRSGFDDDVDKLHTLQPLNMYGYSKHLFDQWAHKNGWLDHMVGLKFFNVFGPRECHKEHMRSLVCKAYPDVAAGKGIALFKSYHDEYADGEQQRDFIYVDDVTDVMIWLMETPKINGLFNLGRGEATTWNTMARGLFKACGVDESIRYIDMPDVLRGQYQYHTCANMDKLRAAGYDRPFTDIEKSLKHYADYLKGTLC